MVVIELIEISHREGKGWSLKNGEKGPGLLVVDRTVGVGFSRPPAFHGPTCPAEREACHMDLVDPRDRTLSSDCWIDNQIKSFSSYPQQFVMPSPLIPLCPSFYQGHPGRTRAQRVKIKLRKPSQ